MFLFFFFYELFEKLLLELDLELFELILDFDFDFLELLFDLDSKESFSKSLSFYF